MTGVTQTMRVPVGAAQFHLPSWASTAFYWLHKGCFLGRVWRQLTTRMENPALAVAGAFVAQQWGKRSTVQVAAKIVLIVRVLLDAGEDGANVARSWNGLLYPGSGDHSSSDVYLRILVSSRSWRCEEGQAMGELFLPNPFPGVCHRISLVAHRFFELVKALGKLCYRLFELSDAIVMTPYEQTRAEEDIFLELRNILGQVDGQRKLESAMEMYRPLLDKLFSSLKNDWSSDSFLDSFRKLSELGETVHRGGGTVVGAVRTVVQGVLDVAGGVIYT